MGCVLGMKKMLTAKKFIKKNIVFCIAAFLAIVTCFFVPLDKQYLGYFDWRTLSCLFLTLAVVCALRNIKFFTILARKLVKLAGNLRSLFLISAHLSLRLVRSRRSWHGDGGGDPRRTAEA